jgi:hypothetical protein
MHISLSLSVGSHGHVTGHVTSSAGADTDGSRDTDNHTTTKVLPPTTNNDNNDNDKIKKGRHGNITKNKNVKVVAIDINKHTLE